MAAEADWHILKSTLIRAVGYDAESRELRVRFTTGGVYRYHDVPADVAAAIIDPPDGSHGRYFNENVRDGYDYDEERR